jgi:hypothetical protein
MISVDYGRESKVKSEVEKNEAKKIFWDFGHKLQVPSPGFSPPGTHI